MPKPERKEPLEPSRDGDIDANVLERTAARYVETRNGRESDDLRELSEETRHWLGRIELRAIIWSAVAGIVAGASIGVVEIFFMQGYLEDMRGMSIREQAPHWAWFLSFILVMSGIEIAFLYWNGLRATARISRIAGLGLAAQTSRAELLSRALGRAAIDLPNPLEAIHGIDPYSRMSKWRIWVWRFLYRLKVGVTSFVLRIFLRRAFGRTVFRVLIPLLAGPLYAVWNAVITWRILCEVKARALGPFAVRELRDRVENRRERIKKANRVLVISAVGEMMIRSRDAHPGFEILLAALLDVLEVDPADVAVDWASQKERLADLDEEEASTLLEAITLASLLDGRVRRREVDMFLEAHALCGRPIERDALTGALSTFLAGRSLYTGSDG